MTKAVIERALAAEMTHELGYERGDPAGAGSGNSRKGTSQKTISTPNGPVVIDLPRDRNGSFEPKIVPKHGRRLGQIDDPIGANVWSPTGKARFDVVVVAAGAGTSPLAAQVGIYTPTALAHHVRFGFPLDRSEVWQCWIDTPAAGLGTYQHQSGPGVWSVGGATSIPRRRCGRWAGTRQPPPPGRPCCGRQIAGTTTDE
jgi:hypothetical protein